MSVSLVRKSLQIVDEEYKPYVKRHNHKNKDSSRLHREKCKIRKKHNNGQVVNILSVKKKMTVTEARKIYKSKEDILRDNLKKLELIRKASSIDLDKNIVDKIIQRAVDRRPIKKSRVNKKEQKTAFTEEDFKKFEEEYLDE